MPDLLFQANRFEKMDVGPHQPGGMRPGKLVESNLANRMPAKLAAAGLTDVDFTVGQPRQQRQTSVKGLTLGQYDWLRVCRQWIRINGGDKYGRRHAARRGYFAERTGAKCRPHPRLQQLALYGLARQPGKIGQFIAGKVNGIIAIHINNDRLQNPTLAAMNGANGPTCRCGKTHARIFFVFEQKLPFLYPVTFTHRHRGAHTDVLFT